jgi:FkbM family methyltransferase
LKYYEKALAHLKNLIINRPAFYLSRKKYVRYILFVSRMHSMFKRNYVSKYLTFPSKKISNFYLHRVSFGKSLIFFQSEFRISRFIKGFENAGKRMWDRYQIDQLIGSEIPSAVLDVGANIGEFSYYANRKFKEEVKIIAIEPDLLALECLRLNLNNTKIIIEPVAVSNKEGTQQFFLKTATADSSLHDPTGDSIKTKVMLKKIDQLILKNRLKGPILIKMDTEGHEPEALEGMSKEIKKVKWVSIDTGPERSGNRTTDQVVKILSKYGFTQIKISNEDIVTARRK